jgi:hypothetical protein
MIRLFNTDDGELSESVTEDGSQANMKVTNVIRDLVQWAANRGYSLRDFEALILSHAQSEIARQIITRRQRVTADRLQAQTGRKACVWGGCSGTIGTDGTCDRCGSRRP